MPYINEVARNSIFNGEDCLHVGDLTYLLTREIESYRKNHGDSYATFAEIVAALEQAKDEFQRRVIHPYEDKKCKLNGDCYAPLEV